MPFYQVLIGILIACYLSVCRVPVFWQPTIFSRYYYVSFKCWIRVDEDLRKYIEIIELLLTEFCCLKFTSKALHEPQTIAKWSYQKYYIGKRCKNLTRSFLFCQQNTVETCPFLVCLRGTFWLLVNLEQNAV